VGVIMPTSGYADLCLQLVTDGVESGTTP